MYMKNRCEIKLNEEIIFSVMPAIKATAKRSLSVAYRCNAEPPNQRQWLHPLNYVQISHDHFWK